MELAGKTERLRADRLSDVERAASLLRHGETVAFPTETVYGLGANALDAQAVEKIFAAKQRPSWDPLIVHVSDFEMLKRIATWSKVEEALLRRFWPGPLTLLLPRLGTIPDAVTAARPLVGVRMPKHPVALELIRKAGVPIAAPSANRFGHTSPTTAQHVLDDLDGRIAAVLDGGETAVGLESTVAQVVASDMGIPPHHHWDSTLMVYRPGAVSVDMLRDVDGICYVDLHPSLTRDVQDTIEARPEGLVSPGLGLRHYAPRARLVLVEIDAKGSVARALETAIDNAVEAEGEVGVMLPDGWYASAARLIYHWGIWGDSAQLARRLFAGLRELDARGATTIVCPIPLVQEWGINDAIRDRLRKAARTK